MEHPISATVMHGRRRWLCLLLFLLASVDVGLTLSGQPARYWQGEGNVVHEANPLGRLLLQVHPLALGLSVVVETALAGILLLAWPTRRSSRFVLVLILLHALGAASWLTHFGPLGCVSAFLFLAIVMHYVGVLWHAECPPAVLAVRPVQQTPSSLLDR